MSTHQSTPHLPARARVHCGFQNAIVNRIDAAMDALASLADLAQELRHSELQKIADDAFNALQDAKIQGQRYNGPTFQCENCKGGFRGEGRAYPGSRIAHQPAMRVCERCEAI